MAEKSTWLGPSFVVMSLVQYGLASAVGFCFNAWIDFIQKEFQCSLSFLELLGSLPTAIPMLAAPVAMILNFKIGTWRILLLGTLLSAIGLGTTGLVQNVGFLFFTYGALVTLGLVLLFNPPFFLIGEMYPFEHPRHVLATSIALCGSPLAVLVVVPLGEEIGFAIGWRLAYVILAVFILITGLSDVMIARLWTKSNTERNIKEKVRGNDEDKIQTPTKRKIFMYLLWFIAAFTKCYAYFTPLYTLVKHMDSMRIPQDMTWKVMPVIGAIELVSRLLASYHGDKFKGKALYMYVACCLILGVIHIVGPLFSNYVHFMVYATALGLFGGPLIAAVYACSAEVLGGEKVPFLFSIFRTGMGVAIIIGPVIAGAVDDSFDTFQPMFYSYAASYFLTALIYAVILAINKWYPLTKPQDKVNLLKSINSSLTYQTLRNEENTLETGQEIEPP